MTQCPSMGRSVISQTPSTGLSSLFGLTARGSEMAASSLERRSATRCSQLLVDRKPFGKCSSTGSSSSVSFALRVISVLSTTGRNISPKIRLRLTECARSESEHDRNTNRNANRNATVTRTQPRTRVPVPSRLRALKSLSLKLLNFHFEPERFARKAISIRGTA